MTVFKITSLEGFDWLLPVDDEEIDLLRFDGTPRVTSWTPVKMRRLMEDEDGRPLQRSDFPSCSGGDMLMLSENAHRALGVSLAAAGELLPLFCGDEKLWALNVTSLIDALDEARSSVLRSAETGRILRIKRPEFRGALLEGVEVFKLSVAPRGLIYVTDRFVDRARATNLEGISFERVWSPS